MAHPSKDIVGTDGSELERKRIVLGITGSASAYKAADIARAFMRHGADVHAVMTQGAQEIIHPNLMEWATGNPVVTKLTGKVEHVKFTTGQEKADLVIIAPATANTIGKIAAGIDDTPVTSYVSSALGAAIPIVIAPAMHDTMIKHPIIEGNINQLRKVGVTVLLPTLMEGKAKLADVESILEAVIMALAKRDLEGLNVLITGGPTVEPIDPVRAVTNRSSGKMAVALAKVAARRGAKVTLVYGPGSAPPPNSVRTVSVRTAEEMLREVKRELSGGGYHMMIAAAAVSDYRPKEVHTKKISSRNPRLTIELERTPKIIDIVKNVSAKTFLVIFKAEHAIPPGELVQRGRERMQTVKADMAVVNDVGREGIGFGSDSNEVMVIHKDGTTKLLRSATKLDIAEQLLTLALHQFRGKRNRGR
jgi:phosphopantothenoylcysteine decarboxylase/phosphopantothenate--cysteine ligase